MRLDTRAFARDKRADIVDAACIQDVPGLDPAASRRANAEMHLARERLDAVAVAVHHQRDASGDGPPRHQTVQVEVARRAVDLHGRTGFRGRREQSVEIHSIAGGMPRGPVGGMGNHVDERMLDGAKIALREPRAIVTARIMQGR